MRHGPKGFEFRTGDNRFLLQIQPRVQLRFTESADADPEGPDDFEAGHAPALRVQRARLKVGGHAFEPWLNYYFEYELASAVLLDFRVSVEKWPALRLRVGQWKVEYNRERVISSGQQQLADRSLVNRTFTLDRQDGISLYGRLQGGGAADLSWWAGAFTGTGRGERTNDDGVVLWTARLQWNPLGRVLDMTSSDVERRAKPELSVAGAGATNRSPYTAFSQAGGGELPGFAPGEPGQYRVKQGLFESAFMHRGFSWQQELHTKRIDDRSSGLTTRLIGGYAQAGYFLHEALGSVPSRLELAARFSLLDPDQSREQDLQRELALAFNWFFQGHLNKLTSEVTWFRFEVPAQPALRDWRIRLQWDVSF